MDGSTGQIQPMGRQLIITTVGPSAPELIRDITEQKMSKNVYVVDIILTLTSVLICTLSEWQLYLPAGNTLIYVVYIWSNLALLHSDFILQLDLSVTDQMLHEQNFCRMSFHAFIIRTSGLSFTLIFWRWI